MNQSSPRNNGSLVSSREPYHVAVTKNMIVLALGLTINSINGMLVYTFSQHQIFNTTPRYILFIHLVINDMIQLTTSVILHISSYLFLINTSVCLIFISLIVFTTLNSPVNLAVMAVECYIAICFPLRHVELCTIKKTYILIAWIWSMSSIGILPDLFLIIATEPRGFFLSTVTCIREAVLRHPVIIRKRELMYPVFLVAVWLVLIYTYIHIFVAAKAAKSSSGEEKKARNTILLHAFQLLLCMLTYIQHFILGFFLYLFPRHFLNVIFTCYIFIHIMPRLISPIVYGLRDKQFRQKLKKKFVCALCFKI